MHTIAEKKTKGDILMKCNVDYIDEGFIASFYGSISMDDIHDVIGKLHGHVEFDDHHYQIFDFLNADLSNIVLSEPEEAASMDYFASRSSRSNVKVALIACGSHAIELCSSYIDESKSMGSPWLFGIFNSLTDAKSWVKS